MRQEVKDYLDLVLNQGLENGYWLTTKQKMDYYLIFTQAKVVETYNSQRHPNENFGSYYSRFFRENEELNAKYPTQGASDNTYRNAISAESLGFFYRERPGYETGIVTDAYRTIARYVHNLADATKYAYLFERQVEKLCLNVNPTLGNYTNLSSVRNFPTMFLYKILYELKKRTDDSTLYYDEFVVFLVRAKSYSDWEDVLNLILWKRNEGLDETYKEKYNLIFNDVTSDNIRFDALLGKLKNVEYTDKKHGYYFKIKDSIEAFRYIENAIEIFEASRYSSENNAASLLEFLRSDKYFIGNLDAASTIVNDSSEDDGALEYEDILNHNLYGIHIKNENDALDDDNPHICIGWSALGDLTEIQNKDELGNKYESIWPDKKKMAKAQDVGQIWRFIGEAQVGDYVIFAEPKKIHIGVIVSDYFYDNVARNGQDSDYTNNRKVEWIKKNVDRSLLSAAFHHSLGSAMSFFSINDYRAAIVDILNDRYEKDEVVDEVEDDYVEVLTDYDTCERNKDGTNVILYGVPGAGKSWTIKEEYCDDESRMERLVFHPDYTYSDFVGQIMPVINDDGSVSYAFNPGPFTKLVKKAYQNPDKHYYLIIEEVNRGNAPAIFGDVFQLLDRKKDGSSEYAITNADIARIVYGNESHKVSIPSNMSILCTMNTSDQNVFTLDTAFQRRWNMRLIQNKFRDTEEERAFAETKILDTDVTWEKFFTEINKIILSNNIRMTSAEDKRLGAHFVAIEDLKFVEGDTMHNKKFPEKVLKYLWDDAFKFNKENIFNLEKVQSLEDVIGLFMKGEGNERFRVFKDNIFGTLVPPRQSE